MFKTLLFLHFMKYIWPLTVSADICDGRAQSTQGSRLTDRWASPSQYLESIDRLMGGPIAIREPIDRSMGGPITNTEKEETKMRNSLL